MTNVLLVEDYRDAQISAVKGIADACNIVVPKSDLESEEMIFEIGDFKIQVVSCMRDATQYLREVSTKKLITILDGSFPHASGGKARYSAGLMLGAIRKREELEHFLIPYSLEEHRNEDIARNFGDAGIILSSGGKSQEAVKIGFEKYLEKYS